MRQPASPRILVGAALAGLLAWSPAPAGAQEAASPELERGREVYDRWCAACHGFEGDGLGPAAGYMIPRPRDFTRGLYQIRSTAGGELPTDADLMRMINDGMPGTTMPGWRDQLSRGDREAVLAYIKSFYPPFETMGPPDPLEFGRAPRSSADLLADGRAFFDSIECWQCHGQGGRGDGPSAPELEDDWGYPIRAMDLTKNWKFNGGGSVEDVYERLVTGLDGTPMPAHWDLVEAGFMTEEQLWGLAHYVRSLAPDRAPRTREVIRAGRLERGELPATLDDERWEEASSFFIPLAGQVIIRPRWFDPAVDNVWVQALHDGEEVALRITWHDRSESPDPSWMQWQERVLELMEPKEGEPVEPAPRPDRLAVQFPRAIPDGMERPYFLMGNDRSPVYLWTWRSDEEGARNAVGRGMDEIEPLPGELHTEARWEEGRWEVLLRRSFTADDPASQLEFETGVSIPIAFFVWDGDNGEEGTRGALSSWFFLHLERETPPSTYIAPVAAFLITGSLGLFVVARAQRRERGLEEAEEGKDEEGPEGDGDGSSGQSHT